MNKLHPITALLYFIGIMYIGMVFNNPFLLAFIILILIFVNRLTDRLERAKQLKIIMLMTFIFMLLINPLISSKGRTLLFYIFDYKAVTFESIIYGLTSALSLITILLAFCSFNAVLNGEKLIYLFSGISKNFALIVVMVLRYIPFFGKRYKEAYEIRTYNRELKKLDKIVIPFSILTSVFARSLEDGFDTSVSMKARGFGLFDKRGYYSDFKFKKVDLCLCIMMVALLFAASYLWYGGFARFAIYPQIKINGDLVYNSLLFALSAMFAGIPIWIEIV